MTCFGWLGVILLITGTFSLFFAIYSVMEIMK